MVDANVFLSFMEVLMSFLSAYGTDCGFWDLSGDGVVGMADFMDFLAYYQPTDWNGDAMYSNVGPNFEYGCGGNGGGGMVESFNNRR